MKVLLHICCAPCALYTLKQLRLNKFEVTGYYYNPNIHPPSEYKKRKEQVYNIGKGLDFKVVYPPYDMEEYFRNVPSTKDSPNRCSSCWQLRLSKTASFAKDNGFDAFTTTLLISPYQNHELVKEIANTQANKKGIGFYYEDFRKGFRESQKTAKDNGMYRQKYCGCVFSELEQVKVA